MIGPHSLHRPQRDSGRPASSKASASYRCPRSRIPRSQRRLNAASPRTASTTEDEPPLFAWNRARTFVPPNHLISARICTPVFSASSSSRSFFYLPSLACPMYRGRGMLWMRIHFHFCWVGPGCVCVISSFNYPATCGPKGHGSSSTAALADSSRFIFPPLTRSRPKPAHIIPIGGAEDA